jgi:hypothetical protein
MDSARPKSKGSKQVSLTSREGTGKALSPAFVARQFKPGQSGNPTGHKGADYGDVIRMAREASPRAVQRLVELVESADERVALLASQAIIERGYGKPREYVEPLSPAEVSAAAERRRKIIAGLIASLDAKAAAMHAGEEQPANGQRSPGAVPVLSWPKSS